MEETIPDVTVYRLDNAINVLEKKGIKFKLKKTVSPFSRPVEDTISQEKYRVIKQVKLEDTIIELTIVLTE